MPRTHKNELGKPSDCIDPFRADVTVTSQRMWRQKLEGAHSNQRRFGYIRSLKYNLVVMLGARIDVVEAPI